MEDSPQEATRRFLVIGCGSIGSRHIGNLTDLDAGEILAFDIREDRRREMALNPRVKAPDTLEEAWGLDPDVVLVTSPTSEHIPHALQAAQHGCHLFIEKPLADSLEGIGQLLDVVRKRNLMTLVGCNMRFHPGIKMVKQLVEEGAIGRVVSGRIEAGQYLPEWRPQDDYRETYSARRDLGGGVILDAIHELDYIRWMLGEVTAVACFAGKFSSLEIDTEDTAGLLLRFANGSIGEVHLDYIQRVYSRTCHIIGEGGTIRWDYTEGQVRWYSAATGKWNMFENPPNWEPNQMYIDEMKHFLKCLDQEEKPALDVFEGERVLEIALAAKTSADTGKVIELRG